MEEIQVVSDILGKLEGIVREVQRSDDSLAKEPLDERFRGDLYHNIDKKQREALALLQNGFEHLYAFYRETEKNAKRLVNVHEKEVQLSSAKKVMKRYFDTHAKLQDEQRDYYEECVRLEQIKVNNLMEDAVNRIAAQTARSTASKVFHIWHRKLKQKVIEKTQQCNSMKWAESVSSLSQREAEMNWRKRVLARWYYRASKKQIRRLGAENSELERQVLFFQQQAHDAQKALSEHLSDEKSKSLMLQDSKNRECEILDEEVDRLKLAVEELTDEFGERSRTYIRQQEELQSFFHTKEAKLKALVVQLQHNVEEEKQFRESRCSEYETLLEKLSSHYAQQRIHFGSIHEEKMTFVSNTLSKFASAAIDRNVNLGRTVKELQASVDLLSPLSGRVAFLDGELKKSTRLLTAAKNESHSYKNKLMEEKAASGIQHRNALRLKDQLLVSRYFSDWWTGTQAAKVHRLTQEKEEYATSLLQVKNTLASRTKEGNEAERLWRNRIATLSDTLLHTQEEVTSLRQQRAALEEQNEGLREQEVKHASDTIELKAQLRQLRESALHTSLNALCLQEEGKRCQLMTSEIKEWDFFLQSDRRALCFAYKAVSYTVEELSKVNAEWYQHCDAIEQSGKEKLRLFKIRCAEDRQAGIEERMRGTYFFRWMGMSEKHKLTARCDAKIEELIQLNQSRQAKLEAEYVQKLEDCQAYWRDIVETNRKHYHNAAEEERRIAAANVEGLHQTISDLGLEVEQLTEQCAVLQGREAAAASRARDQETTLAKTKEDLNTTLRKLFLAECVEAKRSRYSDALQSQSDLLMCGMRQAWSISLQSAVTAHRKEVQRAEDVTQRQKVTLEANRDLIERLSTQAVTNFGAAYFSRWQLWAREKKRTNNNRRLNGLFYNVQHFLSAKEDSFLHFCTLKENVYFAATDSLVGDLEDKVAVLSENMKRGRDEISNLRREIATLQKGSIVSEDQLSYLGTTVELLQTKLKERDRQLAAHASDFDEYKVLSELQSRYWVETSTLLCSYYVQHANELAEHVKRLVPQLCDSPVDAAKCQRMEELLREGKYNTIAEELPSSPLTEMDSEPVTRMAEVLRTLSFYFKEKSESASNAHCETLQQLDGAKAIIKSLQETIARLEPDREEALKSEAQLKEEVQLLVSRMEALERERGALRQVNGEACLNTLATKYEAVLDNFIDDIQDRRQTFYTVNGILGEVDEFTADLMMRFNRNAEEMRHVLQTVPMKEGLKPPDVISPNSSIVSSEDNFPEEDVQVNKDREQITQLEQLLVQTKLELAHTKEEVENLKTLGSLGDVALWKDQASEDYCDLHLSLSYQEILSMYCVFQERFSVVMAALREAKTQSTDATALDATTKTTARLQETISSLLRRVEGNNAIHQKEMHDLEVHYSEKMNALQRKLDEMEKESAAGVASHVETVKTLLQDEFEAKRGEYLRQLNVAISEKEEMEGENVFLREQLIRKEAEEERGIPLLDGLWAYFDAFPLSIVTEKSAYVADCFYALGVDTSHEKVQALEYQTEQLETENMQMKEKLSCLEAPSVQLSSVQENDQVTLNQAVRPTQPPAADPNSTRDLGDTHTSEPHHPSPVPSPRHPSTDPIRTGRVSSSQQSASLESLDVSQSLLRYSKMLSTQNERNSQRLNDAYALSNEVEDILSQGNRIRRLAEQSGML
ncbi:hypothetical protein ADEAN_000092300 [Angomonas deanei]|uniref:Uncharacterized protein n=1 Tax=Angomonas deanei TaxID=59799 RepID=A0A7G2C6B6_9TRYP|nr:hypothetical protein ADEAN_000092300 [Angomonas deanei]